MLDLEKDDEKRILFKVIEKEKDIDVTSDILDNIIKDIKAYKLSMERQEIKKENKELKKEFQNEIKELKEHFDKIFKEIIT